MTRRKRLSGIVHPSIKRSRADVSVYVGVRRRAVEFVKVRLADVDEVRTQTTDAILADERQRLADRHSEHEEAEYLVERQQPIGDRARLGNAIRNGGASAAATGRSLRMDEADRLHGDQQANGKDEASAEQGRWSDGVSLVRIANALVVAEEATVGWNGVLQQQRRRQHHDYKTCDVESYLSQKSLARHGYAFQERTFRIPGGKMTKSRQRWTNETTAKKPK